MGWSGDHKRGHVVPPSFNRSVFRMHDTEDTCHCGEDYSGSDHCPACGCEQYESTHCHGRMDEIEDPYTQEERL